MADLCACVGGMVVSAAWLPQTARPALARRDGRHHCGGGGDVVAGGVACADDGIPNKPAPDPVLAFAKFADVAPAEIAVVGDTVNDLAAARAAGALAIGVLSGPTDGALLEPLADVILPSVAELEAWIDRAV